MALHLDIHISDSQKLRMASIPATSWFTSVAYKNAQSPIHPSKPLLENNEKKLSMSIDWIRRAVKGKRVLDLFSANGCFTFLAALAGAKEVVGVEFSEERVRCAEFIKSTFNSDCKITFIKGDVYKISDYFDLPFDVTLCLGGLYHIADPPYLLNQIGHLTTGRLIMQTSHVLSLPFNLARFKVRGNDKTKKGMTSIRSGLGVWEYTPACLREMLIHGGFRVIEEKVPPLLQRKRFPWYLAYCEKVQ